MNASDWITIIGIAMGLFVTTIGSSLLLAFKMGAIHQEVKTITKVLEKIPWIEYTIGQMQGKLDVLWDHYLTRSNSPKVLNEAGQKLLDASKIDRFIEQYYTEILSKVKAAKPENAYQAQEALVAIVSDYQNVEECRLKLQDTAFSSGYDVNSLLFVGALAIRDRVILELGFSR